MYTDSGNFELEFEVTAICIHKQIIFISFKMSSFLYKKLDIFFIFD